MSTGSSWFVLLTHVISITGECFKGDALKPRHLQPFEEMNTLTTIVSRIVKTNLRHFDWTFDLPGISILQAMDKMVTSVSIIIRVKRLFFFNTVELHKYFLFLPKKTRQLAKSEEIAALSS